MSTRSYICIENPDHTYTGIYCHSDGYLTHNGAILLDHYSSREKVEKLISLGDLSVLKPNIDPNNDLEHSFDNRQNDVCVFYGRDRGEDGTSAKVVTIETFDDPYSWIEYCYVYTLDNNWKYFECGNFKDKGLSDLVDGLSDEYKELGFKRPKNVYGYYTSADIKYYKSLENDIDI